MNSLLRLRLPDYHWEPRPWVPVTAVVAASLVHIAIVWGEGLPIVTLDEIVMLGNSRVIAGVGGDWTLAGAGFMPGLAILIAPSWWFTDDPWLVYRVGLWLAAALNVASILPLSRLAMLGGVNRAAAITIAAVAVMAPARALPSNYLLSESLLVLCTAMTLVAADRLCRRPTLSNAVVLGLATGAVVVSHGRGIAVACAVGIWCVARLKRARLASIVSGVVAFSASLGAYGLYRWVSTHLFLSDARIGSAFGDPFEGSFVDNVAEVVGQAWYAVFAWPAIVVAGVALLIHRTRALGAEALLALMVACSLVLTLVSIRIGMNPGRLDAWFYGRYNDHLWTVIAVVGLALLVRVRSLALSVGVVAATGAVALAMFFVTAPRVPVGGNWVEMHIFGVSPWLSLERFVDGEQQDWGRICLATVAFAAAICVLAWIRHVVVPVLAVAWFGLSVIYDHDIVEIRDGPRPARWELFSIDHLPEGAPIGIDVRLGLAANLLQYVATGTGHSVAVVNVTAVEDPETVVYALSAAAEPRELGAKVLEVTNGQLIVAWVYPGHLQDELLARAELVNSDSMEPAD